MNTDAVPPLASDKIHSPPGTAAVEKVNSQQLQGHPHATRFGQIVPSNSLFHWLGKWHILLNTLFNSADKKVCLTTKLN